MGKNAVYCTLPGLIVGMLYQYIALQKNIENVYSASTWKKLLEEEELDVVELTRHLISAYGCNDSEKCQMHTKRQLPMKLLPL